MTAAHTPAPWVANIRRFPDGSPADVNIMHGRLRIGGVSVRPETEKSVEANAYLLAASPELLAACQKFVDSFKSLQREKCDVAHAMAVAAIAKAEGR